MDNEYSICMAIALIIYLVGWYVFVQIIKRTAPVEFEEWKRQNEESKERDIPDIKLYYIIVGLASLWVLWVVLGALLFMYWLIKKIVTFLFDIFA